MYKEITILTDKRNYNKFDIVTSSNFKILTKIIHRVTVWKMKRYLKYIDNHIK